MKKLLLFSVVLGIGLATLTSFKQTKVRAAHRKLNVKCFIPDTLCNLSDSAYYVGDTFDTSYELYATAPYAPANIVKVKIGSRFYYAKGTIYMVTNHIPVTHYNVTVYAGCDSTSTVIYTGSNIVSM